jgi:hypothetical protein
MIAAVGATNSAYLSAMGRLQKVLHESCRLLDSLILDSEDGNNIFLRNVDTLSYYTA